MSPLHTNINISERELILVGKRHTSNALWLRLRHEVQPYISPIQWTENWCLLELKHQGGLSTTWVKFVYFDLIVAFYLLWCLYLSLR